jgi:hypothetical protein
VGFGSVLLTIFLASCGGSHQASQHDHRARSLLSTTSSLVPSASSPSPTSTPPPPATTKSSGQPLPGIDASFTSPFPDTDKVEQQAQFHCFGLCRCRISGRGHHLDDMDRKLTPVETGKLSENDCTPSCAAGTSMTIRPPSMLGMRASIYGPAFSELEANYQGTGPNGAKHERFSLPTPAAPSTLCSAAELQASVDSSGTSGLYSDAYVQLMNTSTRPCHMSGYPGFELLGATGNTILNATRSSVLRPSRFRSW